MAAKSSDWRPGPTVCRCCLTEGCYKDISTEYFWMGKREVYSEMLLETFDLTVAYAQTGGPNSNSRLICEPCISRLRDACDFKRQVVECERVFHQHLAGGSDDIEGSSETVLRSLLEKDVKQEMGTVKVEIEAKMSDDEDFGDHGASPPDDDDDDLDDQPLTKLATKVPKKETVDLMDLMDNAKPEKRKSTTKVKTTPSKKVKKKETPKPSASKAVKPPAEKKKKESDNYTARRNAELIVQYTTAYPFRLPEESMVCVYCCDRYDDPTKFREHMDVEHRTFKVYIAFRHISEGYIKADCTDLRCRLCAHRFNDLDEVANHLVYVHKKTICLDQELGLQPFILHKDRLQCALCSFKALSIRQLSRHTQSHFLKYTCESCGKSYSTVTSLNHHVRFSHTGGDRICRKCKKTFNTLEQKRIHLMETPKCWSHLCGICNERFISWNVKQIHMGEVHGHVKKTYPCPECSEVFADRKKYRSHFKIVHTDDNFMCSCCGMKFDSKRGLEEHTVVHTREKMFPCTVCSKSFSRKKNLVQHMWIHNELKRFGCTECNKVFNQRVSWKSHMKSHHPTVNIDKVKNNNLTFFSMTKLASKLPQCLQEKH